VTRRNDTVLSVLWRVGFLAARGCCSCWHVVSKTTSLSGRGLRIPGPREGPSETPTPKGERPLSLHLYRCLWLLITDKWE
jgi:hypothetical protein